VPYNQYTVYLEGQAIDHPVFGLGFVRKVMGATKVEVIFEQEVKVLVMNRTR
jgi:hypothetical protein